MSDHPHEPEAPAGRRAFLTKTSAVVIGAAVGAVPVLTGVAVFLDPLRRKGAAANFVRVASLPAIPDDGTPVKFSVVTSRVDAWTKYPMTPVGAVYVRKTGAASVQAFNVVCPHAGCFVDFVAARKGYLCPCHDSTFALDGKVNDPRSPSPRGLDELEAEIRNGIEVWVKFQNFLAGIHDKIPLA